MGSEESYFKLIVQTIYITLSKEELVELRRVVEQGDDPSNLPFWHVAAVKAIFVRGEYDRLVVNPEAEGPLKEMLDKLEQEE